VIRDAGKPLFIQTFLFVVGTLVLPEICFEMQQRCEHEYSEEVVATNRQKK
jgi:hypothetical protein